ncbi:DUF2589 domain-containing protein [Flavivirga aquimarina]|uniref:DUF2589 domain-containing protein n=1 Tax=Flavivirga aquimarina TaxID=2027862 RepID=A0ABT8WBU3_9FLAO|nr:DUF2589 domain-containing protein [Flavivirga aquimarina]MDO5970509.1 DUF2589 domain-containing protein [Flavivirga aquimarina]
MKNQDKPMQGVMKPMAIEKMVAAPIIATVKAQSLLNDQMVDFFDNVALDKKGELRMIPFSYESNQLDAEGKPTGKTSKMAINLPFLTLMDPPSLAIETVEVSFDLRIHASSNYSETQYIKDAQGRKIEVEKDRVAIETSLANRTSDENRSDTSARYKFKVMAKKQERPESLNRILDILTESSIIPKIQS